MVEDEIQYHEVLFSGSSLEIGKILCIYRKQILKWKIKFGKEKKVLGETKLEVTDDEITDFVKR